MTESAGRASRTSAAIPAGCYLPVKHHGSLLFISSVDASSSDFKLPQGRVGDSFSVAEAREHAALCARNIAAAIERETGSLETVAGIVHVRGMICCTPEFAEHPKVLDGCSETLIELFGENGKHARTVVGVTSLPGGTAVEVEAIVALKQGRMDGAALTCDTTRAMEISLETIRAAQRSISGTAVRTPLVRSEALSQLTGGNIYLKLETLQPTGSFKVRGITNKVSNLTDAERRSGLITVSSGNHGRAMAWIARELGVEATICLYSNVPAHKVDAIKRLGGRVEICGETYEEAEAGARALMRERGLIWCDPFDDPDVISGQGVIGLEIADDLPDLDMVVVPLSGGGLFSGIATAIKAVRPAAALVGVANRHGNGMLASLEAGQPIPIDEHPSLADCMAGTITPDNRFTFEITQRLIDHTVLIEEEEIAPAVSYGFDNEGLILEGGAALPIAAMLSGRVTELKGKTAVLVLSGRNIDSGDFLDVVRSGAA